MMMRMMAHTNLCRDLLVLLILSVAAKHHRKESGMLVGKLESNRKTCLVNTNRARITGEAEAEVTEVEGEEIVDGAMSEVVDEEASKIVEMMAIPSQRMKIEIMVTAKHRKAHQCLRILRCTTTTTTMCRMSSIILSSHIIHQLTPLLHSNNSTHTYININISIRNSILQYRPHNRAGEI
jgi:hypothetical protein